MIDKTCVVVPKIFLLEEIYSSATVSQTKLIEVEHGESLLCRNIVSFIKGHVCPCEWCDSLMVRIQSRVGIA